MLIHHRTLRMPLVLAVGLAVVVLVTAFLVIPAGAAAQPLPSTSCENVRGTFEGLAFPSGNGLTVVSTAITGPLGGDGASMSAVLVVTKVLPGGTMHVDGSHTFTNAAFGTFSTSDFLIITSDGRINNTLALTDRGAGSIHAHGAVNLLTGHLAVRYHGRICI